MGKKLSEMTLEELWQLFPIFLTEHRTEWGAWYEEERAVIADVLFEDAVIHHIGSTSIDGIWAKPIIDILIEIPEGSDLSAVKDRMMNVGYRSMWETEKHISMNKGYTEDGFAERVFHAHIRYAGDRDEILFRDYLRTHPEDAQAYEALKLSLWKRYEHNRDAYTEAKTEFITERVRRMKEDLQDGADISKS